MSWVCMYAMNVCKPLTAASGSRGQSDSSTIWQRMHAVQPHACSIHSLGPPKVPTYARASASWKMSNASTARGLRRCWQPETLSQVSARKRPWFSPRHAGRVERRRGRPPAETVRCIRAGALEKRPMYSN